MARHVCPAVALESFWRLLYGLYPSLLGALYSIHVSVAMHPTNVSRVCWVVLIPTCSTLMESENVVIASRYFLYFEALAFRQ